MLFETLSCIKSEIIPAATGRVSTKIYRN